MALLSNVFFYRVWAERPGPVAQSFPLSATGITSYNELMDLARILTRGLPPVIEPAFSTQGEKDWYHAKVADKARMSNEEVKAMLEGTRQ